jgi:hypothetical protein
LRSRSASFFINAAILCITRRPRFTHVRRKPCRSPRSRTLTSC